MCSTFWSRADGINKRRNDFFASCAYGLQYVPRVIITDKLRSYGAAKRELLPGVEHLGTNDNTKAATIERKTRTNPTPYTTARKEDAALQISPHTHNAFFLLLAPLLGIFNHDDTVCVLRSTMPFYRTDSSNGMR